MPPGRGTERNATLLLFRHLRKHQENSKVAKDERYLTTWTHGAMRERFMAFLRVQSNTQPYTVTNRQTYTHKQWKYSHIGASFLINNYNLPSTFTGIKYQILVYKLWPRLIFADDNNWWGLIWILLLPRNDLLDKADLYWPFPCRCFNCYISYISHSSWPKVI